MLRYIERIGLIAPRRSSGSYRLFGAEELQRLRTLRELLHEHDVALGEIGFALRLRRDRELREAVETWLQSSPARPPQVPASDWLRWEQDKHQKLMASATRRRTIPTLESV